MLVSLLLGAAEDCLLRVVILDVRLDKRRIRPFGAEGGALLATPGVSGMVLALFMRL
jgi:hypothetical protein